MAARTEHLCCRCQDTSCLAALPGREGFFSSCNLGVKCVRAGGQKFGWLEKCIKNDRLVVIR